MSDRDIDALVIVHHPADGGESYVIGPFPPVEDWVKTINENTLCDCRREVLAMAFPKGIRMAIIPDPETLAEALGLDLTDLIGAVNAAKAAEEGPVH